MTARRTCCSALKFMIKHALLYTAVAPWMFAATLAATTPDAAVRALRDFDLKYRQGLTENGVTGSSFLFMQDDNILDRQFYGLADRDRKIPVDEDTIYHWASITKTFTGIAIMQLRDRGLLKLDDPAIDYIPELRDVHNPFGSMRTITIRQLMSHTAGFRASTWPWGSDKPWHPFEPRSWNRIAAMLSYTEIEFQPGSRFSYSNLGVVFLGRIIELLSGDPYEVYIDKNIFKPLKMHRSYFATSPYYLLPHRAHSYWTRDGQRKSAVFDADTGITNANGGLNAPIADMAKYLGFLIGTSTPNAGYEVVLKRASLEEMWRPQLSLPDEHNGKNRKDAVGLSFFLEDNFGQHFVCHSGFQNGFSTHFYLNPIEHAAYVIAFNDSVSSSTGHTPDQSTARLDRELKEFLFERVFSSFNP